MRGVQATIILYFSVPSIGAIGLVELELNFYKCLHYMWAFLLFRSACLFFLIPI